MTHFSDDVTGSPEDPFSSSTDGSSPTSPAFGGNSYSANSDASDLYAAGSYGAGTNSSGQNPDQNSAQYPGQHASQPYGTQSPYGTQPYSGQPYGAQPYGSQSQPYGAQQFGAQPYGAQSYNPQQYGAPAYGAMQPFAQAMPVARKEPGLMLLASFFIPGLGTILNGETGKGIGILVGYFFSYLLIFVLIGIPMVLGLWVWGMVDAYKGAQRFNAQHGLP